ncbi:MAG TPA: NADPH-dependent FMN reductase [Rugosibacter sp.]|mgnify:CR=1 FL=1|nr:NADPH-dependent FMN reductase [Rugosibacter sp.]HPB89997.1 NADPH-dependent FMN reductase [Rugosibacter sp.]HQN45454.1 NADPH-dependent FMN reductase [Rugosibacter sp.]HQQ34867.1 NADPH-dependent FMN reductase [Rugosibacter sp.]
MSRILIINGSPSATSRTGQLLSHFAGQLAEDGWQVSELALRTLPAEALLSADFNALPLTAAARDVAQADAIVVATPVYKAAYTALLKAFLDVLPQQALADKSVLPIASGGTLAHYGVIDYALKPVLSALGATYTLPGFFVLDADLKTAQGGAGFNPEILSRLESSRVALNHLHRIDAAAVHLRHYGS